MIKMRGREVGEVESGNSVITLTVTVSDDEAMKVKIFLENLWYTKLWGDLDLGPTSLGVKCESETIPKWLFNEQEAKKVNKGS